MEEVARGRPIPHLPSPAMLSAAMFAQSLTLGVLITSFFHAIINTYGLGIIPMMVIGISPVLGGITGIVGIVAFGALGAWLLARTPESRVERSISG